MAEKIQMEEEFNNFMHKVTEVNNIVKKLASQDKDVIKMGEVEADRLLKDFDNKIYDEIDEKRVELKVKDNKTVINKIREETVNENEMSQAGFMREIERDAKQRYEDKRVRKEKSDTIKVQANKAFRKGEYEKALSLYNKAIELIKDSGVLYTNRALTYINLTFYDKAIKDCETALKLNENSLRSWMYIAKAAFLSGDQKRCEECIKEALQRNPEQKDYILKLVDEFKQRLSTNV